MPPDSATTLCSLIFFCLPGQGEATSSLVEEFEAVYRCFEEREKVNTTHNPHVLLVLRPLLAPPQQRVSHARAPLADVALSLSLSLPTRSHTLLLLRSVLPRYRISTRRSKWARCWSRRTSNSWKPPSIPPTRTRYLPHTPSPIIHFATLS